MITYRDKNTLFIVEYIDPEKRQVTRVKVNLPGHLKNRYRKALLQQLAKQGLGHVPYFDVVEIQQYTTVYQMDEKEFMDKAQVHAVESQAPIYLKTE